MKIKLSEKASNALVSLHELYGADVSITHFLNTLITDYQQLKHPTQKDHYGHSAHPHLHTLQ